ncbi:hypothetical protein DBR23_24725 [Acidovorax sp. HMWF018]|nr:hypothetical protein DBR23_24725 [Acidovorax sp. HMWF018]
MVDYSQYIRPEVWPIPATDIGYMFERRYLLDDMCEIRCVGELGTPGVGRVFVLDIVPCEHIRGVIDAIVMYRTACSKLIG